MKDNAMENRRWLLQIGHTFFSFLVVVVVVGVDISTFFNNYFRLCVHCSL